MTPDEMVELYQGLKAKAAEIEARHKNELVPFKTAMAKVEGTLDRFMNEHKLVNIKTPHGTAYFSTKYSASLTDPDQFMGHVISRGEWSLLDRKANVTAVKAFAKEHGHLPPGTKLDSRRTVRVVKDGAPPPFDVE